MGRRALLAWKVDRGSFNGIAIDGLAVVAALSGDEDAAIGVTAQHMFTGSALGAKWSDPNKRSSFFGTFSY